MAITLNKCAIKCEEIAIKKGDITPTSSARTQIYDISRHWRTLCDASKPHQDNKKWSEREEAAAEILIATLTYLRRIDCKDIELLLKDTIERHARQSK